MKKIQEEQVKRGDKTTLAKKKKSTSSQLPLTNYLVYCLASETSPNQTYVGITNNFKRRIRQHNGEITGGARRTRAYRPWKPFLHITNLTKTQALQLEWALKHRRKGPGGYVGRVKTLEFLLGTNQWTKKATPTQELRDVCISCTWSEERYMSVCGQNRTKCDDLCFQRKYECNL